MHSGTQNVAGPQHPSVKQTCPAAQSALVVQADTQVGCTQIVAPSVVFTQAQPPMQLNVAQSGSTWGQTSAPEITCADTVVTDPTIIGAT